VKHTFLHFVDTDEELKKREVAGASTRSRSEDVKRNVSLTKSNEPQLCVERLNQLLQTPSPVRVSQVPTELMSSQEGSHGPTDDELRQLQRRLAETAGRKSSMLTLSKRIESSGSVSTMAPDLTSDCEEKPTRLGGIPKAWSSGSVSSMASDWEDMHQQSPISPAPYRKEGEQPKEETANSSLRVSRVAAARDGTKAEFCHNLVPKNQDFAEEFSKNAPQGPPTTMMIRNIPNRYTQREFMKEMEGLGFGGTYDFLYLPIDKGTLCNVGYAFVNFVDPCHAQRSMEVFKDYVFLKYRKAKGKIAAVSVAHLQGLEANLRHYENSAVNGAPRIKQQRGPVIFPQRGRQ